ncbi:hypothetical protein ACDA63_09975 [Uliginosibacterium sp. sgz301328]|uniref:hypothetical protein n=1 Tax=Uliginosibacterium sp. sgz301328 TaxID=3243764 RepID=UPI00359E2AE2
MKKTDLEKNLGLKINGKLKQGASATRFGAASGEVPDRREQRKLDAARGLIPFAVKLEGDLVTQLRTQAETQQRDINELVAELLRRGLAG